MCPTPGPMLFTTQCVNPPAFGASGSYMIRANDFVFGGASFHESSGEIFSPSLVKRLGILTPSWKSTLVNCMEASRKQRHAMLETPADAEALPRAPRWVSPARENRVRVA